jgi:hypothetical protein
MDAMFEGIERFEAWWNSSSNSTKLEMLDRFGLHDVPTDLSFNLQLQIGYVLIAAGHDLMITLRPPELDKNFMLWAEGDREAIIAFDAMVNDDWNRERKKLENPGPASKLMHQVGGPDQSKYPWLSGWEYWINKDSETIATVQAHFQSILKRFGLS